MDVDNVVLTALLSGIPSCRKSSINVSCCYSFNKNLTTHLRGALMIEWMHTSKCDSLKAMNEWMARRNWEAEDRGQKDRREEGGRLSVYGNALSELWVPARWSVPRAAPARSHYRGSSVGSALMGSFMDSHKVELMAKDTIVCRALGSRGPRHFLAFPWVTVLCTDVI